MRPRTFLVFTAAGALAAGVSACRPRPAQCAEPAACGPAMACVAGRCQREGDDAGVPEIDAPGTRRIVARPVAVAWIARGARAASPPIAVLGRRGDDAALLLRYALALPRGARVVEAYVVLTRADEVTFDAAPLALHLARVVEPWDPGDVSFARAPRLDDVGAPVAVARAGGARAVRIDARAIVTAWAERDPRDAGLAVVGDGATATGLPFTCVDPPPLLEVYVR